MPLIQNHILSHWCRPWHCWTLFLTERYLVTTFKEWLQCSRRKRKGIPFKVFTNGPTMMPLKGLICSVRWKSLSFHDHMTEARKPIPLKRCSFYVRNSLQQTNNSIGDRIEKLYQDLVMLCSFSISSGCI